MLELDKLDLSLFLEVIRKSLGFARSGFAKVLSHSVSFYFEGCVCLEERLSQTKRICRPSGTYHRGKIDHICRGVDGEAGKVEMFVIFTRPGTGLKPPGVGVSAG